MRKNNKRFNEFNSFYQWKIGWLRTVDTLHILHDGLYNANKIDVLEAALFIAHFIVGTNINDRINWNGSYYELNYFINQLMKRCYIPYRYDEHMVMWEHFLIKGNEINTYTSHQSKSRGGTYNSEIVINKILDRMDHLQ